MSQLTKSLIAQLNDIPMPEIFSLYGIKWEEGRNFRCPFPAHGATGKTPSGRYYPLTNSFGCFGCHKGGGPINFVMNMEGFTFRQACDKLMKWKGIEGLPAFSYNRYLEKLERNNSLYFKKVRLELLSSFLRENNDIDSQQKFSVLFMESNLLSQEEFLKRYRELVNSSCEEFSAGAEDEVSYLVRDNISLIKSLEKSDFTSKRKFSIKDSLSGFCSFSEIQRWKNQEGRYLFPVFLPGKFPVGFEGRTFNDQDILKYLGEFDFGFNKDDLVYGLDLAIPAILENDYIIVVEGILDVLRCRSLGFNNVIAPMSTSLSIYQILILKAFSDKFLLVFDKDSGGEGACTVSKNNLDKYKLLYEEVSLPEGEDPDSYGLKFPEVLKIKLKSKWR